MSSMDFDTMKADFTSSVRSVLTNYNQFTGRSARSEYWWFTLFAVGLSIIAAIIDSALPTIFGMGIVGTILSLALLVPWIAVGIRRLHDTDRSGWFIMLGYGPFLFSMIFARFLGSLAMLPMLAVFALLYFLVLEGTKGPNQYGPAV